MNPNPPLTDALIQQIADLVYPVDGKSSERLNADLVRQIKGLREKIKTTEIMDASKKLEEELTWPVVHEANILIGKVLEFEPQIEYAVCTDGACCYSPANVGGYFSHYMQQKQECERWLAENNRDYPDGLVAKGNYKTTKLEHYPFFHGDWNFLMKAIKRLRDREVLFDISTEIDVSWKMVWEACKSLNHASSTPSP